MKLSLREAAEVVVQRHVEYRAALEVLNARTFDKSADFRSANLGYAESRRLLAGSVDDLKTALEEE